MIAYEDLVIALTNWRAAQGMPTSAVSFLVQESSVDLALPVGDPVEAVAASLALTTSGLAAFESSEIDEALGTSEVVALDDVVDEYSADQPYLDDDSADYAIVDPEDEIGAEQTAIAGDFSGATAYGATDLEGHGSGDYAVGYHDETNYGDAPAMQDYGVHTGDFQIEDEQSVEDFAAQRPADPLTEEVDILAEEANDEGPTQFGDMEGESTSMGLGSDNLRNPRRSGR